MIRLVVCMDFDTDDLKEAYAALCERLEYGNGEVESMMGWETSDEWFLAVDDSGGCLVGDQDVLQSAIVEVLEEKEALEKELGKPCEEGRDFPFCP